MINAVANVRIDTYNMSIKERNPLRIATAFRLIMYARKRNNSVVTKGAIGEKVTKVPKHVIKSKIPPKRPCQHNIASSPRLVGTI